MYKYFMLFLISLTKISEIKTGKTFAYLANKLRYQFESFAYIQVMGKFIKRQPNGKRQTTEPPYDNFDSV